MDRVRFGRALGYGARHAAKTLVSAVDAATTPNPARTAGQKARDFSAEVTPVLRQAAEISRNVSEAKRHAKREAGGVFRGFLAQLKHFSSVLWLQVTGTFFAVFAIFIGGGIWKLRADFRSSPNTPEAHKLYFYVAIFLVFAYFTVSSFVRASRREAAQRRR